MPRWKVGGGKKFKEKKTGKGIVDLAADRQQKGKTRKKLTVTSQN